MNIKRDCERTLIIVTGLLVLFTSWALIVAYIKIDEVIAYFLAMVTLWIIFYVIYYSVLWIKAGLRDESDET